MKKLLLLATLAACGRTNNAEIIAKGQNPDLTCDSAVTRKRHIEVTVCTLTVDKDKKITKDFIAATSSKHPFQAYQLKTLEDIKAEAATPPPAPVVTPDAGVGSGK